MRDQGVDDLAQAARKLDDRQSLSVHRVENRTQRRESQHRQFQLAGLSEADQQFRREDRVPVFVIPTRLGNARRRSLMARRC